MKKTKNIIALIIIVVLMSGLLVVTYFISKDKISVNELINIDEAYNYIFPDADSFMNAEYNKEHLNTYLESVGFTDEDIVVKSIVYAKDTTGRVIGILINLASYKRNGGSISSVIGVRVEGNIKDIVILEITDQRGLDVQVDTPKFLDQFKDKFVEKFELVSTNVIEESDVLEVIGAHDASLCMVNAVNGALETYTFLDGSEGGFLNY